MGIFYKLRRWINPTFGEWLEDMQKGFEKEMQKPEWKKISESIGKEKK